MWIKGQKNGVGFWYVLWGQKGKVYNMEVYLTLNGLANWFRKDAYRDIPVLRIGRMVVTEKGFAEQEREQWTSRKEFLEWAKPLVGFPIPEG